MNMIVDAIVDGAMSGLDRGLGEWFPEIRNTKKTEPRVEKTMNSEMAVVTASKDEKTINIKVKTDALAPAASTDPNLAIEALKQIAALQNNNKLRSWRGSEAVRIAKEALKTLGI
jgi:hypothetical protein